MDRTFDRYWVWSGLILGGLYLLGYVQLPDVGLSVLSIFFAGLLAISSIIPCVQNYDKIKFIKQSGHMKDLLDYISLPLRLSFALIVLELAKKIFIIPESSVLLIALTILTLSLWGVFVCSLFRIIILVPKLIDDSK